MHLKVSHAGTSDLNSSASSQRPSCKELEKYWTGFSEYVAGKKPAAVVMEEELRAITAEVAAEEAAVEAAAPVPEVAPPPVGEPDENGAGEAAAAAAAAAQAAEAAEAAPLVDPKLTKFVDIRSGLFYASAAARAVREPFEAAIKRPYFHVKPLDDAQVANWEQYLTHEVGCCKSKPVVKAPAFSA